MPKVQGFSRTAAPHPPEHPADPLVNQKRRARAQPERGECGEPKGRPGLISGTRSAGVSKATPAGGDADPEENGSGRRDRRKTGERHEGRPEEPMVRSEPRECTAAPSRKGQRHGGIGHARDGRSAGGRDYETRASIRGGAGKGSGDGRVARNRAVSGYRAGPGRGGEQRSWSAPNSAEPKKIDSSREGQGRREPRPGGLRAKRLAGPRRDGGLGADGADLEGKTGLFCKTGIVGLHWPASVHRGGSGTPFREPQSSMPALTCRSHQRLFSDALSHRGGSAKNCPPGNHDGRAAETRQRPKDSTMEQGRRGRPAKKNPLVFHAAGLTRPCHGTDLGQRPDPRCTEGQRRTIAAPGKPGRQLGWRM